jgi:hypothetical protein
VQFKQRAIIGVAAGNYKATGVTIQLTSDLLKKLNS